MRGAQRAFGRWCLNASDENAQAFMVAHAEPLLRLAALARKFVEMALPDDITAGPVGRVQAELEAALREAFNHSDTSP